MVLYNQKKKGDKTMTNTICYKLNNPIYYNKGTKWEKACDTFLAYYTYKNDEEAQAEAKKLTAEKPAVLPTGVPAPADVAYYFVKKQGKMY